MYSDGLCLVSDGYYTKSIQFEDINYLLSRNEDQLEIYESWKDFLNYFDPAVTFELTFVSLPVEADKIIKSVEIAEQDDEFNNIRREYSEMLERHLSQSSNGLVKTKYITFGINADSVREARARVDRIEGDLLSNFKRIGVNSHVMDGYERLKLLHDILHMDEPEPFEFSWDWLVPTGLSVKDFIAPSSFYFKTGESFKMGNLYCRENSLVVTGSEIQDRIVADFLKIEAPLVFSIYAYSIDQAEAVKTIKRKITDIDQMKIQEQQKAVRSGYDMDLIPTDLSTYGTAAKDLLQDLQSRNERMFQMTIEIMTTGKTMQELSINTDQAKSIAQQNNCTLVRLDFQQEDAFRSCLPLGKNTIEVKRGIHSSGLAGFIPFTTQELFQQSKEAVYCGVNASSGNLIMCDRKLLTHNSNGLILGTPGSGKSFAAKREITNVFFVTKDDIIICDPESEYGPLVNRLGGQIIRVSPTSADHINPMDIDLENYDDENPLALKTDFILSLCELIIAGRDGLEPEQKSIIDRCVRNVYRVYQMNPSPENMPVLGDLYDELRRQPDEAANYVANCLEMYVNGSLNVFNHRTNIDVNSRIVCFDIRELGKQLKKIGMLIVQDQVWNRVSANREKGKTTRYYIDEMHLLLRDEQTAAYTVEIWKRFRKWGGMPTGITQNVSDLLSSSEIENIFGNSDYILMLNQAQEDRKILAQKLNISPRQLSHVTQAGAGEGLLFYGNTILPFVDRFPADTEMYRIMTTKFGENVGNENT